MYTQAILQSAFLLISSSILKDNADHNYLASLSKLNPSQTYDYIVIGGGTAGSVVASRLSDTKANVLVLEEGGAPTLSSDIPAMDLMNILGNSTTVKRFITQPQKKASFAFKNRQINIATASVLGGGSSVNGMAYNRGGKLDYDGWAKDYGCTNWSYEDVLPFFRKSENQLDPDLAKNSRYHGKGGPLSVKTLDPKQSSPNYARLSKAIIEAAKEIGYKRTDINGANQVGTGPFPRLVGANGKRESTATAFLTRKIVERQNLFVLTRARVNRIIFDGEKRAVAVSYTHKGKNKRARLANGGEIILSAGAIMSPKILLQSGVGPQKDLKALGIPVVANLPVGKNFQDHTRVGGVDFVCNETLFDFWEPLLTLENLDAFYRNGNGPLANNIYLHQDSMINVKTTVPTRGKTFGPVDLFIAPALLPAGGYFLADDSNPLNTAILKKYYNAYYPKPTLNFFTALMRIQSVGYVKLNSTNPNDPPLVDPNYFGDKDGDDLARAVQAYKLTMTLGETKTLKDLGCVPYNLPLPGCEHLYVPKSGGGSNGTSDEYIICKIRHLSSTELHPSGSCRMAGASDPTAVVDPQLRVLGGITGLRVADSSIQPSIVTGNNMAVCIMIGERAADFIIQDRNQRKSFMSNI